jgi:hypothetical protein
VQEVVVPCPACGETAYQAPERPATMAEMVGSQCPHCGYALTKPDLQKHFQQLILKEAAALLSRMPQRKF